jgi:glycosyltransferase involved in cell wall biosynthesis
MPAHVTHIITGLAAGGAETMLYKLLERCDRAQIIPEVISLMPCAGLPLCKKIEGLGIRVNSLQITRRIPAPGALFRLLQMLKESPPELIAGWEVHGNLAALATAYLRHTPLVWNVRGSLDDLASERLATRALIKGFAKASHVTTRIVYNSHNAARQHERAGYNCGRTMVIPNGFDCDLFRPDGEARASVRSEIGIDGDLPLIGMMARYHAVKDHQTLLSALAVLDAEGQDFHLILAGRGVDSGNRELTGWIEDLGLTRRVSLLGERHDMHRLTASLDIACLSSVAEAFPNAIGEAMACGVPCVVTDVGDAHWIVHGTGRAVPARHPTAFATAVRDLLRMPGEQRREMGQLARKRVMERFSIDVVAKQFDDLFTRLASLPVRESRYPGAAERSGIV